MSQTAAAVAAVAAAVAATKQVRKWKKSIDNNAPSLAPTTSASSHAAGKIDGDGSIKKIQNRKRKANEEEKNENKYQKTRNRDMSAHTRMTQLRIMTVKREMLMMCIMIRKES